MITYRPRMPNGRGHTIVSSAAVAVESEYSASLKPGFATHDSPLTTASQEIGERAGDAHALSMGRQAITQPRFFIFSGAGATVTFVTSAPLA